MPRHRAFTEVAEAESMFYLSFRGQLFPRHEIMVAAPILKS